jgi:predicted ABC-type exoprotein transport system permease subunit
MPMWGIVRWILASITLAVVTHVAQKNPRLGAFILTLPILSILAILLQWQQSQDLATTSKFARDTLVLVPLGLPFFVPLAFADRLGMNFWPAFGLGLTLATCSVGTWLWLGK